MSMVQAASVIGAAATVPDRYTRPALIRQGLQAAGREEPGDACAPRIGANAALAGTSTCRLVWTQKPRYFSLQP